MLQNTQEPILKVPFLPDKKFDSYEILDQTKKRHFDEALQTLSEDYSDYVSDLLIGIGGADHIPLFKKYNFTLEALISCEEADLRRLGIPEEDIPKIATNLRGLRQHRSFSNPDILLRQDEIQKILLQIKKHYSLLHCGVLFLKKKLGEKRHHDYFISNELTAAEIMVLLSRKALQQIERMEEKITNSTSIEPNSIKPINQSTNPVRKPKKTKRTRTILKLITLAGFTSILFLTRRLFQ